MAKTRKQQKGGKPLSSPLSSTPPETETRIPEELQNETTQSLEQQIAALNYFKNTEDKQGKIVLKNLLTKLREQLSGYLREKRRAGKNKVMYKNPMMTKGGRRTKKQRRRRMTRKRR